ncbi:MAG: septation protein IspZ, partial [Sphingomonas sp.]
MATDPKSTPVPASPGLRMAIDYGPLIVFFGVNFLTPGVPLTRILAATVAFMLAMMVALAVSWIKTRHVSPMLWLTGVLVIVFGGLTLYFHDQKFIQMKPTFVYALFA